MSRRRKEERPGPEVVRSGKHGPVCVRVEQGSPEWVAARIGIPTASQFDRIVTPGGAASAQARPYMHEMLAEWILGASLDCYESEWMARGKELEPDAVAWYELQRSADTEPGWFWTNADATIGASPDRLIADDGLAEFKCPAPQTHVANMLGALEGSKHRVQIQGQLLVTGRLWCDLVSYHPEMRPVILRVPRDEAFLDKLRPLLDAFVEELRSLKVQLVRDGHVDKLKLRPKTWAA